MDETNLLAKRVARLEAEVIVLRKKVGVRRAYLPPWLRGSVVDFEQWVREQRSPHPLPPSPLHEEGEETLPQETAVGDE